MSAGALLGKDTDTSSVLRFGLTGLKPIKVSEVIKLGGVKLRRIYRNFAPSDTIRTYDDYANIKYTTIFNSIKIPDQFDVEILCQ